MRLLWLCALLVGCAAVEPPPAVTEPPPEGGFFVVAGQRVRVDTPIVHFDDPGGYDAYDRSPGTRAEGFRYRPGRAADGRPEFGATLEEVRARVDLLVIHYDACGTSRRCFEVLQSERGLSAHFLLDLDGTVYQTLDLADTAWHAGSVNARSIGIEIAHRGAFPPGSGFPGWTRDAGGWRAELGPGGGGLRNPEFVPRPARPEPVAGVVQGRELEQLDFTDAQYEALIRLSAALLRTFPRIRLAVPRDARGRVRDRALDPDELAGFSGILGHWHVGTHKIDPGPAFDWERYLRGVRAEVGGDRGDRADTRPSAGRPPRVGGGVRVGAGGDS